MMQNLTEFPAFDLAAIPLMNGCDSDVIAIEQEVQAMPHLADRRLELADIRHDYRAAFGAATAAEAIGRLPGANESLHLVIGGRFALWDCVPALIQIAGENIAELHVATLGFSKANVAAMADLLDSGKIGKLALLCSHYFSATSKPIYDYAAQELPKRGARFASLRTHAKVLALRFTGGRTATIESSANLRSCKNIEQLTVTGNPALYAFHVGWIESLLMRQK